MSIATWYKKNLRNDFFQPKKRVIELYRMETGVSATTAYTHYKKDRKSFVEKKDGKEVHIMLQANNLKKDKNESSIGVIEKIDRAIDVKNLTIFEKNFCLNIIARFGLDFDTAYKITKTIEELE